MVAYRGNVEALMADWDRGILTADQKHEIIAATLGRIIIAHVGRGRWPVDAMRQRVAFG